MFLFVWGGKSEENDFITVGIEGKCESLVWKVLFLILREGWRATHAYCVVIYSLLYYSFQSFVFLGCQNLVPRALFCSSSSFKKKNVHVFYVNNVMGIVIQIPP